MLFFLPIFLTVLSGFFYLCCFLFQFVSGCLSRAYFSEAWLILFIPVCTQNYQHCGDNLSPVFLESLAINWPHFLWNTDPWLITDKYFFLLNPPFSVWQKIKFFANNTFLITLMEFQVWFTSQCFLVWFTLQGSVCDPHLNVFTVFHLTVSLRDLNWYLVWFTLQKHVFGVSYMMCDSHYSILCVIQVMALFTLLRSVNNLWDSHSFDLWECWRAQ